MPRIAAPREGSPRSAAAPRQRDRQGDQDAREEHEAARVAPPRVVAERRVEQQPGDEHDGHAERKRPGLAQHQLAQRAHAAATRAIWNCDTATSAAATYRSAASPPGQCTPSPSARKKTPNVESITPTPYFRCDSGSRASGRCTIAPTAI